MISLVGSGAYIFNQFKAANLEGIKSKLHQLSRGLVLAINNIPIHYENYYFKVSGQFDVLGPSCFLIVATVNSLF